MTDPRAFGSVNGDRESVSERCVERFDERGREHRVDRVVVEEPLELRIARETIITTMRTPGDDEDLALGWLLAEGLITAEDEVAAIARAMTDTASVVEITLASGKAVDHRMTRIRRAAPSTSACGVCGRVGIDDLLARCGRVEDESRWEPETVGRLPDTLRSYQRLFAATGGLHAAAAARSDGSFICVREDVGRHNAVDKVVGALLGRRLIPAAACALVVSGRASFEILQKAVSAGFAVVVCVSAPSSLAIDVATKANVTLVAFARDGSFNVYSAPERIEAHGT